MAKPKYRQGIFKPIHPEKYLGNVNNIIYRSGLELRYMHYFDRNPYIISWGSEECVIPYYYEVDHKVHRYFLDFILIFQTKSGEQKKALVEIKPKSQCKPPRKNTKNFDKKMLEYVKNKNKWEAAMAFCKQHQMSFMLLTEDHLRPKR